jgi:hypothetical protein
MVWNASDEPAELTLQTPTHTPIPTSSSPKSVPMTRDELTGQLGAGSRTPRLLGDENGLPERARRVRFGDGYCVRIGFAMVGPEGLVPPLDEEMRLVGRPLESLEGSKPGVTLGVLGGNNETMGCLPESLEVTTTELGERASRQPGLAENWIRQPWGCIAPRHGRLSNLAARDFK